MPNLFTIYNRETVKESWRSGSTMWVVHGPDGIRTFSRDLVETSEQLFVLLEPFFPKGLERLYTVYAN